jgi:hypothetical protein
MSGRLPAWLAERLGVSVPSTADGATWQLDSAWSWAPWATLLLIIGAILWTVLLYAREQSGARRPYRTLLSFLRITALGLLLIMLAQWAIALRITGPPSVALVIDRSTSMSIADQYDDPALTTRLRERLVANSLSEPTRLNLAKLLITEENGRLLTELEHRYRIAAYLVAGGLERVADTADPADLIRTVRDLKSDGPDSNATRLGDGLRRVLDDFRGAPPAAVILVSDGVSTEGLSLAEAAEDARRKGVPLFTIGLGRDAPPRDIELADVLVDDVVFAGDIVSLQAQIKASGLEGQSAKITLRREGVAVPLAEQMIALAASGKIQTVRLIDRPTEAGDIAYVVEVALREDETNKQNNRQQRKVSVRDDKIRVLLVEGYPNFEFRFLKTLLERDRTIKLSTYLQDADPDYVEQDKTARSSFPVERQELFEYDVVIIGDVDPRLLPRSVWQHLRAFVAEKGGGVAFAAGPRFFPWLYQDNADVAALLPIEIGTLPSDPTLPAEVTRGFTVRPTPLGLQNPAFQLGDTPAGTEQIWTNLAPLYWLFEVSALKPGAQVLAEGPRSTLHTPPSAFPAICFQYFGAGRVLFLAVDSTWRWRIGAGDTSFARYWVQTIRFLARGKLTQGRGAQLTTDRREYRRGEVAELRARFLDTRVAPTGDEVTVVVDAQGRDRRRVTLRRNPAAEGVFECSLPDLADGQYEVLLAEPQLPGTPPATRFSVVAPPGEFARPEMDAAALAAAAEATHGKFFTIADAGGLLADLPTGRRVPIENLPPIPIWNRWWLLLAFLTCLTTEWILRKRKGMM